MGRFSLDIHNPVFVVSGLTIIVFVLFALALPAQAEAFFGWLRPALTSTFDWFFLLAGDIFVLVALALIGSSQNGCSSSFGMAGGACARPKKLR